MPTKEELEQRKQALLEKRNADLEKIKKQNRQLRSINAQLSAEERKARTRELIQLGGLVEIARQITGEIMSAERLLGSLLYVHAASLKNENTGMLSSWDDKGKSALIARSQKTAAGSTKVEPEPPESVK